MYGYRAAAAVAIATTVLAAAGCGGGKKPDAKASSAAPATSSASAPASSSASSSASPAGSPSPSASGDQAQKAPCDTATKSTLEAAVRANKQMNSSIIIDSKGLQRISCAEQYAHAWFSNNLDGGHVLFVYRAGAWQATKAGTGMICDDVPARLQFVCR